jgi:hypothetical protein
MIFKILITLLLKMLTHLLLLISLNSLIMLKNLKEKYKNIIQTLKT